MWNPLFLHSHFNSILLFFPNRSPTLPLVFYLSRCDGHEFPGQNRSRPPIVEASWWRQHYRESRFLSGYQLYMMAMPSLRMRFKQLIMSLSHKIFLSTDFCNTSGKAESFALINLVHINVQ
ncbi:hypothetical protein VNO77_22473 [Canavalia gladiata]|uniref:Uncharacterized protein n=1 Tax=Canavalia gladiata TaxID=3824 RepID=A0AAN9QEH4_CANGL